jgi:hypothetical protein
LEEETVMLDHLLLWLSAKGRGSWSQFRSAVEGLNVQPQGGISANTDNEERWSTGGADLPLYLQIRFAMERLGHVEFFTQEAEKGWRVVPPVVVFLADSPERGLLCGARSPDLLTDVRRWDDVEVSVSEVDGGPQRILLRGPSQEVVAARARALGFHLQKAAPIAILSSVPGVCDSSAWDRTSMPDTPGWSVHRFSASRLQWLEVSQADAAKARNGLFRFAMKHQGFYYLRWQGASYQVPVQMGKYAAMRGRRGILAYDSARRALTVPAICRPPLLIERALVLCSGFLPRFDSTSSRLEYRDIPPDVVRVAAQLLRQEVR